MGKTRGPNHILNYKRDLIGGALAVLVMLALAILTNVAPPNAEDVGAALLIAAIVIGVFIYVFSR